MVDLDRDGRSDIISGSWPGELYLFRGTKDGFAAGEAIVDRGGAKIKTGSASVAFASDWDRDGDLDLVVGAIGGEIFLIPNESGGKDLRFGQPARVKAAGAEITVPGGDSGPVVADWDGDGRHDLLSGAGDGSVLFWRNRADRGLPVLEAPVTLVPPSPAHRGGESRSGDASCGMRTKVCVADWNADGRPDLLMGDFSLETGEEPVLNDDQVRERDTARAAISEISEKLQPIFSAVEAALKKELGIEGDEEPGGDLGEKYQERFSAALEANAEYTALLEEWQKHSEILRRHQAPHSYHGWVWVFLRKTGARVARF